MATTLGAFEAKTHLSELLKQVEQGEEITITKHGRPVARLVPYGDSVAPIKWSEFWERVDSRRVKHSPDSSIKGDIESGRA